jgi:hypothetical protein
MVCRVPLVDRPALLRSVDRWMLAIADIRLPIVDRDAEC